MVEFHFLLDQPSLRALQSPIAPDADPTMMTPLSQWIRDYARDWGAYLDTPDSAQHVESFRTNPAFHWDEYIAPPSGFRTFNQFFARHAKPGMRPIAAIGDPPGGGVAGGRRVHRLMARRVRLHDPRRGPHG